MKAKRLSRIRLRIVTVNNIQNDWIEENKREEKEISKKSNQNRNWIRNDKPKCVQCTLDGHEKDKEQIKMNEDKPVGLFRVPHHFDVLIKICEVSRSFFFFSVIFVKSFTYSSMNDVLFMAIGSKSRIQQSTYTSKYTKKNTFKKTSHNINIYLTTRNIHISVNLKKQIVDEWHQCDWN